MRRLNEPSHLDLRCLTFILSNLHINVFPNDNLLKKKADDKCLLKFDAERVNANIVPVTHNYRIYHNYWDTFVLIYLPCPKI